MIEEALRKRLQPIVNRRRRLHLARSLSVYWLVLGLAGTAFVIAHWYWGWSSPKAIGGLCVLAVLATLLALYRYHRMQPDYKAAAANIEKAHPEARELLAAAVEQEPDDYGSWVIFRNGLSGKPSLMHPSTTGCAASRQCSCCWPGAHKSHRSYFCSS